MRTVVYCYSELRAPWGFSVPAHGFASFHVVLEGECLLEVEGHGRRRLGPGDTAIVVRGAAHAVRSAPECPAPSLEALVAEHATDDGCRLTAGGDGERTLLLCGTFRFDDRETNPLFRSLPGRIVVEAPSEARRWTEVALAFFGDDRRSRGPGARPIAIRLSEILFIAALRAHLSRSKGGTGWPAAARDPAIGRALALIHRKPERAWTVRDLAEAAHLSRSRFAARFRQVTGDPPIRYLRRHRIDRAIATLLDTDRTLGDVAREVGYASPFSFSKAFKREVGVPPSDFRERGIGDLPLDGDGA